MLRELVSGVIIGAFALLLFSFGCVDEQEFTRARFECIDLTSQAFARVPECDSQEECFEELEERLFGFPEQELDFGVRQELFKYKNHVARSWLYYNRALKRVNEIRSICLSRKDFKRLSMLTNELNHFLLMAFDEADKANLQSFSILFLEASELEREDVSKIREEQLFDVFIKINNNLNLLSQQDFSGSDHSYYARFLKKVKEFNELSQAKGFYSIALRQFGPQDFVFPFSNVLGKGFVKRYRDKVFFLPFLGEAFSSFVSFLSGSHDLFESLELIRRSPTFEFLNIYSDLLGEKDSVLAEFSSLVKGDCLSRRFLELEDSELEKQISEKISLAREKINRIPFKEFSFLDENFYFSLYSLLIEKAPFSYQEFDFESVREGWQKSMNALESIEFSFHSVLSDWRIGRLSLGERTSRLKSLSYSLDELIESLDYIEGELLARIVEKCDERIPFIESQLEEVSKSQSQEWFFYSRALLEEKLQEFKKSKALNKKIHYCYDWLEGFGELKLALSNKELEEKRVRQEIGECLDALDLFLPFLKDSDSELSKSIGAFKQSLSFEGIASDTSSACDSLLSMAEKSIRREKGVALIEQKFHESLALLEKLKLLFEKSPLFVKRSSIASFEKEASELSAFFKQERIDLVRALDSIPSIKWRASELKRKLEEGIEKHLSSYLSERVRVQSIPVSGAVLGVEFEDTKRIEFFNPFFSWGNALSVSFPFKNEFDGVQLKSNNISDFSVRNSTAIVQFSRLPEGKSFIEIFSSAIVSFSEKEKLVQLNVESAEIEKRIQFDSKNTVSRLKAEIPLNTCDLNVSGLRAFFKSHSVPVFLKDNKAVIFLENLEPKSELFLYYVLLEPLSIEKKLLRTKEIDENRAEKEFSLSVSNKLSFPARNTAIMLAFPFQEENIEKIELFDSTGTKRNLSLLPNKLRFKIELLLPGQRKEFMLRLRVRDESAFTQSLLGQARQKLQFLLNFQNESVRKESKRLLKELEKINAIEFKENAARISKLFDSACALEKRALLESELDREIAFHEQELRQRMDSLRKEQDAARTAGFNDYSEKIAWLLSHSEKKFEEALGQKASNKQKALGLLNEVEIALDGFSAQDISAQLSRQAKAFFKEISEKLNEWQTLGFSQDKIVKQRNQSIQLLEEFELLENRANFSEAKQRIDALMDLSEQIGALFNEEVELTASRIVAKINEFLEINSSIERKLAELKRELESVSGEELVKARIVLPFQLSEIKKIERELQSQRSKYKNSFEELLQKAETGKRIEIIRKAKGIDFDELIESVSEKEQMINALSNSIKASALSSLSEAKNRLSLLSDEGVLQLEEAVNEARKNNYLKSLVLSKTALASLKGSEELDWSIFLYPLFIFLVFLFFRAYKKTKKQHTPFYRRVPRQY